MAIKLHSKYILNNIKNQLWPYKLCFHLNVYPCYSSLISGPSFTMKKSSIIYLMDMPTHKISIGITLSDHTIFLESD